MAVFAAAIGLRRAGAPFFACLLLVLSSALAFHVPPFGPTAMLQFLLAALWLDHAADKDRTRQAVPSVVEAMS